LFQALNQQRARAENVLPEQNAGLFGGPISAALQNCAVLALRTREMGGSLPSESEVPLKVEPQRCDN
jgi:hypothetical protein